MIRSIEQSGFLDESFFECPVMDPQLTERSQIYRDLVQEHLNLLEERSLLFDRAEIPFREAQNLLTQQLTELEGRRRFLSPNPILDTEACGWRRSLERARIHLNEALNRNTIPWPLIWIVRRLSYPDHPSLIPLKQAVETSKIHAREVQDSTTQQKEALNQAYKPKIDAHQKLVETEEGRLLDSVEKAIAKQGDLGKVADYLTILPPSKLPVRAYSAVIAYVQTNAVDLIRTTEFTDFESFVDKMSTESKDKRHQKTAVRLREFVNSARSANKEAEENGLGPSPEYYRTQDSFVTRRFEDYLAYSLLNKLYKQGILNSRPELPSTIQYW